MNDISPFCSDTIVDSSTMEWIPKSFSSFLNEINHLSESLKHIGSLPLFRGHRKREWLLDSTFVRSIKRTLFPDLIDGGKLSNHIVESAEFYYVALNTFLLKFGVILGPSNELNSASSREDLDEWFELMKRYQQYTDVDKFFLKGTNLIDWSQSPDVALYFANEKRVCEGAIYICNATATGKTHQIIPLGSILDMMRKAQTDGRPIRSPLLFCPPRQIKSERARNQQAIYFAQMDLRYDLETIWRLQEAQLKTETIILKMVLKADTILEAREYLKNKGIVKDFIFPEEDKNS